MNPSGHVAEMTGRAPASTAGRLDHVGRATSVFDRVRARAELVLGPIELHAHRLLSRRLRDEEWADARDAAATLARGLGELQLHGLAQLGRQILSLLEEPDADEALAIEIAGAVEDIRTMLSSAIAQLEDSPSLGGTLLAVGEPIAAFDATLWVLANHGHTVVHAEHELPEMAEPPEVVLANVGSSVDAATRTTLRAIGETYSAPVVLFHDDLPIEDQRLLARHCSTLLPIDTSPGVVSDEILRLQAAVAVDLRATVWGHDDAVPVLLSHGYRVSPVQSIADLAEAPYGAVIIGADASSDVMVDVTRLIRVTAAARQAPVVWQGPVGPAMELTAARLGATVVERLDDAAVTALTSSLRFAAAAADPSAIPADSTLGWSAARLLIDRTLIAAQRTNTPCAIAVIRLPVADPRRAGEVRDLLGREFRRGDVVGVRSDTDFVVALQGISHRVALDRMGGLIRRLGGDVQIGVADFPGGGRSAEDLVGAAGAAIERAREARGPSVVSTAWRPAEARAADVMVVDSDVVLGEMLAVALGDRGLGTHVETDGHDALEHLIASPDALPRVLMIDLDFGGADGRALLAALRPTGLLSHMKVLVMATRASENDIRMALDLGATDVMRKPFPVALMLHRIVHLLAE